MLDFFHLPTGDLDTDIQIFQDPSTVENLQWQTWIKPRGKTMCQIICLGGGSGGGGGNSSGAGVASGGGGGGGGSAQAMLTLPLFFLPDVLYIQTGAGGAGSTNVQGQVGANGVLSYVGLHPDTTATNIYAVSGTFVPGGGLTGTRATNGGGGAAGTVALIAAMPLAALGRFTLLGGQIGKAGATPGGAPPGSCNFPGNNGDGVFGLLCTGGGGGGGLTTSQIQQGSSMTQILNATSDGPGSLITAYAPVSAGTSAPLGNGGGGYLLPKPFFSFAGPGGLGHDGAPGGSSGGEGGPGSGGGGGAAGNPTGGRGGTGGIGIIVILSW